MNRPLLLVMVNSGTLVTYTDMLSVDGERFKEATGALQCQHISLN